MGDILLVIYNTNTYTGKVHPPSKKIYICKNISSGALLTRGKKSTIIVNSAPKLVVFTHSLNFFCVIHKKETNTGLEQLDGEK